MLISTMLVAAIIINRAICFRISSLPQITVDWPNKTKPHLGSIFNTWTSPLHSIYGLFSSSLRMHIQALQMQKYIQ